ncbi:MAG: hypothetical protein UU87_C0005G0007 [Parcubacteria group bacterium GW2011_GWA2_42_11]|nr:MAG: hypothetical protein UU87_C0005G0007 [Parcubacteria group bacterium GW2011_GWA2_42_11]
MYTISRKQKIFIGIFSVLLIILLVLLAFFWDDFEKMKYQKRLNELDDTSLVKEINKIEANKPSTQKKIDYKAYAQEMSINLLRCSYKKEGDKIAEEIATFIKDNNFNNLVYTSITDNNFFNRALIFSPLNEICPKKIVELCINKNENEKIIYPTGEEWCKNLCGLMESQWENRERSENELAETINKFDINDTNSARSEVLWRLFLVYRLGGKDSSLKFCDKLEKEAARSVCIFTSNLINAMSFDCDQIRQTLIRTLIDYKF